MTTAASGAGRSALRAALEQLRLKLLDLTGRNRLLNFKHSPGRSLQSVEGRLHSIYTRLVEGTSKTPITIEGVPEPLRADWPLRDGRYVRPDASEWAVVERLPTNYELGTGAGEHAAFRALLYPDDLAKHCRKIEREANLAIEETGANMLFLVLGFIEYPDQPQSDRLFLAPLVSIPVELSSHSRDGQQIFEINYTGDDVATNLSLHEKLRVDHSLILPAFNEDDADLERYFQEIEGVIGTRPGFHLRRRVSLCLLSFTNMLLVRDLDPENWPSTDTDHSLLDHIVVRQLFEGQKDQGGSGSIDPPTHVIDDGPAARIPLVFDADSSQHSALIDVLQEKRHLVIEGPPGTGKSQTITNLIAACIAEGKTVLFVAEKLAALEVVKSRLSGAGLDPFVLELHSSKTSKKRVLEEIGKRIAHRPAASIDIARRIEQLDEYRKQLRSYVDLLKSVIHNTMGLTVHTLIWRTERYRLKLTSDDVIRTPPHVKDAPDLTPLAFNRRVDSLQHLATQYIAIGGFDANSTFWGFYPERLLPGDEQTLRRVFSEAVDWSERLVADVNAYCRLHDGASVGLSRDSALAQLQSLSSLRAAVPKGAPLHLLPRMFAADSTGARVKQLIERVDGRLARYLELAPSVRAGLKDEADGTREHLESLKKLDGLFESLGCTAGTADELFAVSNKLRVAADGIKGALRAIEGFCSERRLPTGKTRAELSRLEDYANRAVMLPESHWEHFNAGLMDDAATASLELLEIHQSEWVTLHATLDKRFYLDALPNAESLRTAILAYREGPAWYRFLQRRWRAASALHKSVVRNKKRVPADNRLTDLESLSRYLQLRNRWSSDPAWAKYCKQTADSEPVRLEGYLAMSRWYQGMKRAFVEMGLDASHVAALSLDQARKFRRDHIELVSFLKTAVSNIETIESLLPKLNFEQREGSVNALHGSAEGVADAIVERLVWIRKSCVAAADFATCLGACDAAVARRSISADLEQNTNIRKLFGDQYRGVATDVTPVLKALEWGQTVQVSSLPTVLRNHLLDVNGLENLDALSACLDRIIKGLSTTANLEKELQRFGACDLSTWCGNPPEKDLAAFASSLQKRLVTATTQTHALVEWSQYIDRRGEALSEGCGDFIAMLEARRIRPQELSDACGYATFGSMVRQVFQEVPELARFSGLKQSQVAANFRRLDREIIAGRGAVIAGDCVRKSAPPTGQGGTRVDEKTEMVLLYHLIPQQRPRVPVRKLLTRAQASVQALKPCLMMGPQAVAQFLEPGGMRFDVVIMDEASQLRPEEAIGAIARGRQLVVVGDPKQLPPTTFFTRQNQLGEEVEEYTTTEAESILDICMTSFRPSRSLRWHYRSQHHSLIAFSNQHFYKGHLIVCPSPYGQNNRLGVRATYLANALYDNQTNLVEAQRVVDAVVEHVRTRPDESLGVVTLNIKQRDLISELLEERLGSTPGADEYRLKWHEARQGLFVKNLENVQGDERDCIVISTTFGRPPGATVVRQNFGPISRQGGWRRLNVLFTRARQSVAIYTSLRPEDIVIDGSTPEGTKALRNYLEYARSGLLADMEVTGHDPDSDFEVAVIEVLRGMNYEVTPQLGVSGFRIDIAVKHPDYPGAYLAAIECDGAQYHSAQSARDRDRIRQEILESQGWRGRIWRIWSTDWFRGPYQEIAKLRAFLDDLRKSWTPDHAAGESWIEEGTPPSAADKPEFEDPTIREMVDMRLLAGEADKEVRIGDTVEYVDASRGADVISVRITKRTTAIDQGLIAEGTPLAQALLGGVVGDEVVLNVPGVAKRMLRIVAIKRDEKSQT